MSQVNDQGVACAQSARVDVAWLAAPHSKGCGISCTVPASAHHASVTSSITPDSPQHGEEAALSLDHIFNTAKQPKSSKARFDDLWQLVGSL